MMTTKKIEDDNKENRTWQQRKEKMTTKKREDDNKERI